MLFSKNLPAFVLVLNLVAVSPVVAQSLVRGPYLQVPTPTSVTVRWRTERPSASLVRYGTAPGQLSQQAADDQPQTEHAVVLTGLQPNTKYYYALGTVKNPVADDRDQYFRTAPPAGSTQPIRIWSLGDFGSGTRNQWECRDAIEKATADRRPDVWIWLGDNTYDEGKEAEYQANVFGVYQEKWFMNLPFFPTPGNHDYGGQRDSQDIPYFNIFSMPQRGEAGGVPSGSKSYYSFDYGNVHFVSLDSHGRLDGGQRLYDVAGKQVEWLQRDLTANRQPWTIVYWHHPPYSKGSHDSDTEEQMVLIRQQLLPVLEKFNVDVVFCGHSHVYERTPPMLGHFGKADTFEAAKHVLARTDSPNNYRVAKGKRQGVIYIVNGSGGQLGGQEPGYPLKAAVYSNNTVGGSVLLDVTDNKLQARWICADGQVRDQFSITKEK